MAASLSRSSALLIRPAKNSIDSWLRTPIANSDKHCTPLRGDFVLAVQGDFYLTGCWQASARQTEGDKSGSGGQVTHRAAAVHRLVLWAGALSTAGAIDG